MPSTTRKVGARVVLDGEKEYNQAIQTLNAGSKTLATEMNRLKAEYEGNSKSIEYLTEKGEILNRQLEQQREKTAQTREMYEKASATYAKALANLAEAEKQGGDAVAEAQEQLRSADLTLQRYAQNLNNAEAAEFQLQAAIEENNAALQGEDTTMMGLGDTVEQLADKLGISIPESAKEALNGVEGFSAGTVAKMAIAAGAIAAVVKVVQELGRITLEVAAEVDDYLTESAITGVATETLQAWDYAAPLIDTDAETIKGAMTKITKAMGDAKNGSGEAAEEFKKLGVSITRESDGSLRDAEEVFYDVIDALGEMEAGTERDAAAMELMGKNAQELNPIINAGTDALRGYAEEAKEVGYILSDEQVAALGAVDDAYQTLQLTIEVLKRQMAADFAPAAQESMELFTDAVRTAGEWLERSGLIENLAAIIQSLIDIFRTAGDILAGIPGFDQALSGLKITLGAIADFVAVIADGFSLVKSLLSLDFSGVKNALGFGYSSGYANNLQRTRMQQEGTWQQYSSYYGYNAGGNDNWRGGFTWVGETGPELVSLPQGSQILSAQDSRSAGATYIGSIVIDAKNVKEFNDIVDIVKNARVRERMR